MTSDRRLWQLAALAVLIVLANGGGRPVRGAGDGGSNDGPTLAAVIRQPFADVNVTGATWEALEPKAMVYTTPGNGWDVGEVPGELAGAQFTRFPMHHKVEEGRTAFAVERSGVVLLGCTPNWGGGGGTQSGWKAECASTAALQAEGWQQVARSRNWILFWRDCKAGETFTLRTEKYNPPILIRMAAASVPPPPPAQPATAVPAADSGHSAADALVGDWQGKGLLVKVRRASDGTLVMSEPAEGFASTASRLLGGTSIFHWSHRGDVLVLRPSGDGTADLDCYPAADSDSLDAGRPPPAPARWHKRMRPAAKADRAPRKTSAEPPSQTPQVSPVERTVLAWAQASASFYSYADKATAYQADFDVAANGGDAARAKADHAAANRYIELMQGASRMCNDYLQALAGVTDADLQRAAGSLLSSNHTPADARPYLRKLAE